MYIIKLAAVITLSNIRSTLRAQTFGLLSFRSLKQYGQGWNSLGKCTQKMKIKLPGSRLWSRTNGLLPDATKPLPKPTLCSFYHIQHVLEIPLKSVFTPQPSGLEGYCRHGPGGRAGGRTGGRAVGRSGGRLPDLRNPYLCNRLMDFLRSKFYGIV